MDQTAYFEGQAMREAQGESLAHQTFQAVYLRNLRAVRAAL